MRYHCHFCGKSVSSELPSDAVIRATLICPECLAAANPARLEVVLAEMAAHGQTRKD